MTTAAARVRDSVCDPGPETGWDQDYQLTAPYFAPCSPCPIAGHTPAPLPLPCHCSVRASYYIPASQGQIRGGGGPSGPDPHLPPSLAIVLSPIPSPFLTALTLDCTCSRSNTYVGLVPRLPTSLNVDVFMPKS